MRIPDLLSLRLILLFHFTPSCYSYNYFAIGSNMLPATMASLRNLPTAGATAALLPEYELAFDIPGSRWIEPSAASVRKAADDSLVHGVLYPHLTDDEFFALGRSEGVPLAYRWERCRVIPYQGDNQSAGRTALSQSREKGGTGCIDALVLTKSELLGGFFQQDKKKILIPPSRSYLGLLQQGAELWKMDSDYRSELATIPTDPLVPGVSGALLRLAEFVNPSSQQRNL